MSSIIKDYYENAGVKPFLIEDKLDKLKNIVILQQNLNIGFRTSSIGMMFP